MKKKILLSVVTGVAVILLFITGFTQLQTTQNELDLSTTPVKLSVTGSPLGEVSIAHDGRSISADSSFRDSYTNMSSILETIKPGTIFTKKAYIRNADGTKGDLEMLFAMIKQKKGYFPAAGDWEYVSIPFDKSTDYKMHPNGILPQKIDDASRGKISFCGDCHKKAAGNDFVFTN